MPSLVLLFWALEKPKNIHARGSVSLSAANLAIKWCSFLEKHAMKIYCDGNSATTKAEKITNSFHGVPLRDSRTDPSIFQSAYDSVADMEWVTISCKKSKVKKSMKAENIALFPKVRRTEDEKSIILPKNWTAV